VPVIAVVECGKSSSAIAMPGNCFFSRARNSSAVSCGLIDVEFAGFAGRLAIFIVA
jgi:hypothetical protein